MAFASPSAITGTIGHYIRGAARDLSKDELSRTISFARIVLIVGLVFLHYDQYPNVAVSPFAGVDAARHHVATFINSFMLFFFFSVVPLLSAVSGWLFFSFDPNDAASSLFRRIKRRFSSLYLPLVSWNVLYLAVLYLCFRWKPDYPLFPELNIRFGSAGAMDYVNAVFAITAHPVGFQFWFVRDLFVTALISPLLWLLLHRAPYLGMAVFGLAWLVGSDLLIFFRTDVVFFFYLGAFLRIRRIPLHVCRRTALTLLATYIALVALRTLAPMALDLSGHRPELLTGATRAMRLLGVLACWGVFLQVARTRFGGFVARYGGLAFFLHAAHFPLLAEVKILLWQLIPSHDDTWMVAHYLVSVAITVTIGLSAGLALDRFAPRWFALMNGGRSGTAIPKMRGEAAKFPSSEGRVDLRS